MHRAPHLARALEHESDRRCRVAGVGLVLLQVGGGAGQAGHASRRAGRGGLERDLERHETFAALVHHGDGVLHGVVVGALEEPADVPSW